MEITGGSYVVSIPVYEGPMDLLLHLVSKNRIEIHDIPIHEITDQYLEYLNQAQVFNLELGSSFFTMAATLLLIKSRTLLPKRRQEEESETEDPRRELEEFKRMKEIRAHIESLIREEEVYRTKEPAEIRSGLYTGKISLQKLSAAFFALYESLKEEETTIMEQEEVSLDDEIEELRFTLRREKAVGLMTYFRGKKTRLRLAVSLMALLELLRTGEVLLRDTVSGLMIEGGRP